MRPQIIYAWRAVVMQILLGALCQAEKDAFFRYAYEKFNDLETKIVQLEKASETKISGLKSEMTQMEEGSKTKISGLESEIAQMKATSETEINKLESKIAQILKQSDVKYLKIEQDLESLKTQLIEKSSKQSDVKYLKIENDLSSLKSELSTVKTAGNSETKINKLESKIAQMEKASKTKISGLESEIAQMKGFHCQTGKENFGDVTSEWKIIEIELSGFKSIPSFSYALSKFMADNTGDYGVYLSGGVGSATQAVIYACGLGKKPASNIVATWIACGQ